MDWSNLTTPSAARVTMCALTIATVIGVHPTAPTAGTWPTRPERGAASATSWFADNGFPVPAEDFPLRVVLLGDPPTGLTVADVERAATRAGRTWTAVTCASASIEYAGRRASLDAVGPDERPFQFTAPQLTPCFPAGAIGWTALTCTGRYPDKSIFLNTSAYDWSTEPRPFQPFYVNMDSSARLTVDVASVLTHEFGHLLGLSHSDDHLATMTAAYRGDGGQRTLAVDDKLGLCSLYGVSDPPAECTSGRDCGVWQQCERIDELRLCRERRGGIGDACGLDRLVCPEVCLLEDGPDGTGYCTAECGQTHRSCPQGFECTEGLVESGKSHCARTTTPGDPGCDITGEPTPTDAVWALIALAGLYWHNKKVF